MIKYLETTKGKLPVRISYFALKKYQEKTGKSAISSDGALSNMLSGDLEYLLYFALKKGHQSVEEDFKLEMKDMEDLMDEVFFDFIKLIPEFFPKNQPKQGEKTLPKSSKPEKK